MTAFYFHYLFFFTAYWYRVTQFFSHLAFLRKVESLPRVSSMLEIPELLNHGDSYKTDPVKGVLDALTHPGVLHSRVIRGEKIGDCDDHAAYWLACGYRGDHIARAWVACVNYKKRDGKNGAHAVALWKDWDGQYWWADYGVPLATTFTGWMNNIVFSGHSNGMDREVYHRIGYGTELLAAALVEVKGIDDNDGLIFGTSYGVT